MHKTLQVGRDPYKAWYNDHVPQVLKEQFPECYPQCLGRIERIVLPFLYYCHGIFSPDIEAANLKFVASGRGALLNLLQLNKPIFHSIYANQTTRIPSRTDVQLDDEQTIWTYFVQDCIDRAHLHMFLRKRKRCRSLQLQPCKKAHITEPPIALTSDDIAASQCVAASYLL